MAPFNPEVRPTNDPTYGANSRAIDTPEGIRPQGVQQNQIMPEGQKIGDVSAQYEGQAKAFESAGDSAAMKGYGDLFGHIVGIADYLGKGGVQIVKKDIENKVYEIASNERSAYTAELEKIKANIGVNKIIADTPETSTGEPVPEAVSDLGNTLATLKSARDGGKITKTDYMGRLAAEAQLLRSQYPGFKSEIDQEFQKVTGQNPANARVNGLITEINRAAAAAGSQQNKTLQFIRTNQDAPGAEQMFNDYQAGKISDSEVFGKISTYNQAKERIKLRGLQNQDRTMTREEASIKGKEDADYASGVVVATAADRFAIKYGFATPESAEQLQQMQKNGNISSTQWEARNQELQQTITGLRVSMMRDMDSTGTTKRLKGGKEEAKQIIETALEPLKAIQTAIVDKNVGAMHSASRESQAVLDDGKKRLLTDSKAGPIWAGMSIVKELGGEQYVQNMSVQEAFGKNGPADSLKEWKNRWSVELEAQAASKKPGGKVTTFNDLITEMAGKKIDDPIQQKKIVGDLVNKVSKISDSTIPDAIKVNIIKAAFSPDNKNFLSKLNIDSFDERGRPVSGMNAVFQKWTTPEVTREIERLGRKDPTLWNNYTDWVKSTWGTELVPREMAELSKYQKDPNIKIGYDTENKRFTVERTAVPELQAKYREGLGGEGRNTAETMANQKQFETVSRSINRINAGLYTMRHVAEMENPKDPSASDAFFLRAVMESTSPEVIKNINSLPADLVNKVLLGNANANRKR